MVVDESARARFFASIERIPFSGCWIWTRSVISKGYGCIRLADRTHYAHRISWEIHHGQVPRGSHVLHRCDVPSCCNPEHLFLGTNGDNIADSIAKGRRKRPGEKQNRHILSGDEVLALRERYKRGGVSQAQLARERGVSKACINHAIAGINWKHL